MRKANHCFIFIGLFIVLIFGRESYSQEKYHWINELSPSIQFSFQPETRSFFIELFDKNTKKQTIQTLVGIGPEFVFDGVACSSNELSIVPVATKTDKASLICFYEVRYQERKETFSLLIDFPQSFEMNDPITICHSDNDKIVNAKITENEANRPIRIRNEQSLNDSKETRKTNWQQNSVNIDNCCSQNDFNSSQGLWGEIQIRIQSDSTNVQAVRSGLTLTKEHWVRFCSRRYGEAYAQPFWPRTAYFPSWGIFLDAAWSLEKSQGTCWDENDDNRFSGQNDFVTCPGVLYQPKLNGERSPVDETLTLRIGNDLWQTVPSPKQKSSEFLDEMKTMIYLDLWSGTALEAKDFLQKLSRLTQHKIRFLTVFQNWECGGWDALLPDSILMPDYPPNPTIGTVDDFIELSHFARTQGRFALRTNYVFLRVKSPSYQTGKAHFALDPQGKAKWHIRLSEIDSILSRQEEEIKTLFHPNATFSDQLTSGAAPWAYHDFNPEQPIPPQIKAVLKKQRDLTQQLKKSQNGPLGSESLMDEHLLGEFVDFGDFGIYDGFHRSLTPEFKLRRLQHLSVFYGMGLMYRFFEMPPFDNFHSGKHDFLSNIEYRDDYRASEILYGNGAYFFYLGYNDSKDIPWDYVLTEALLVGMLQKYYLGEKIDSVSYWFENRWQSLTELLEKGIDPTVPVWLPQSEALKRIKVIYQNGLHLIVNRLDEEFPVEYSSTNQVILPKSGWVAWKEDGSLLAFSAKPKNHDFRIDFIEDRNQRFQYLDPRKSSFLDCDKPTLWINDEKFNLDYTEAGRGDSLRL